MLIKSMKKKVVNVQIFPVESQNNHMLRPLYDKVPLYLAGSSIVAMSILTHLGIPVMKILHIIFIHIGRNSFPGHLLTVCTQFSSTEIVDSSEKTPCNNKM